MSTIDDAVKAAGERIGLYEHGNPGFWATFRIGLEAAAPVIAAAAIASHEHTWVRCEQCKSDGPCPCSGGICCPGQQREIEEYFEGAADARKRIRELAVKHNATYRKWTGAGPEFEEWLFADLLREET